VIAVLATQNRTAILIGLALVGLLALSAWPVYYFGQAG
jgi:outer membrane protein assembly factor BamE (lipoprotein component of BamABCDE complex)